MRFRMQKGSKKVEKANMTDGAIVPVLISFMLPLIGGSIFQQLYNTADFLFVGNFLGKTQAAAVGSSSTLINCTIGLFTGLAIGSSVIMSQAIGAKNPKKASTTIHTSLSFGLVGSIIMMIVGMIFARDIMVLMKTPSNVLKEATTYIQIYFLSLPAMILYNMLAGALRSLGDSKNPFYILVICGVVNVISDWLFICAIPWGVAGVAIATAVSQYFSVLLAWIFLKRYEELSISVKKFGIDGNLLVSVLKIGVPAGVQSMVITISNVVVQYYINGFGETPMAAFATYYKVENFIYIPIMAIGQAATVFVGQNLGAGKLRRIWRGNWIAVGIGIAITLTIAGLMLSFPHTVFGWFMKDEDVVADTLKIVMVSFPLYWIYAILEVTASSLRAMGYAFCSMIITLSTMCLLRIVLLAIFNHMECSLSMIAAVYPITWGAAAMAFAITFTVICRKRLSSYETNISDMQ